MQVESKKSFNHGFILTEADLRRTVEAVTEQFKKLANTPVPAPSFKMKFKNGVIAETNSIDDVLSQENIGSSQIIRLKALFKNNSDNDDISVEFEFINADLDEETTFTSARYSILGSSRDWVFVTSTILDERFAKVKRFAPNQLSGKGANKSVRQLIIPLVAVFIMFSVMLPAILITENKKKTENPGILLEQAFKKGEITDTIEALIFIEKEKASKKVQFQELKSIFFILGGFGFLILLTLFFIKYFPIYNFCWGDYIDLFNRKESVRKFVLTVVIVGIVVSFIGGILANLWKSTS